MTSIGIGSLPAIVVNNATVDPRVGRFHPNPHADAGVMDHQVDTHGIVSEYVYTRWSRINSVQRRVHNFEVAIHCESAHNRKRIIAETVSVEPYVFTWKSPNVDR